jgi:hypothetical protein
MNWRQFKRSGQSPANVLGEAIRDMEADGRITLPNLRRGTEVIVASDYSADNRSGDFKLMSFLFLIAHDIPALRANIAKIRDSHPKLGMSVPSYKDISPEPRDGRRPNPKFEALPNWLSTAGTLDGLLFSFAMPLTKLNWFSKDQLFDMSQPDIGPWSHWNRDVFVRALTVTHIIGAIIGGLVGFSQRVTWITDNDSIAERGEELQELFRRVMRLYSWRPDEYVTSYRRSSYSDPQLAQELLSIPDLTTGALTKVFTQMMQERAAIDARFDVGVPIGPSYKDRLILNWLNDESGPLRWLAVAVSRGTSPNDFATTSLRWKPVVEGPEPAAAMT